MKTQPGSSSTLEALVDAAPFTAIQARVVLLCTLVTLIEGIDLNLIPLLAPDIAKDWALPPAAFGVIFSAGPIGLIIGGLSVGYFADRFGRRQALIGAMVVMTLATVAMAFVRDVPQLLVCRILTGIGFGGVLPAATSLVSEFLPSRTRASVVAFVILGQSVGGLSAAVLMKLFPGAAGWQTIILAMGVACAMTTALLFLLLPESPRYLLLRGPQGEALAAMLRRMRIDELPMAPARDTSQSAGGGQFRALFADGRAAGTLLLWATFVGVCAVVSFFTSWLTLMYTEAGRPVGDGVSASAFYWAGGIVSGLVLPLFCLRWREERVLMVAIATAAASCALLGSVLALASWPDLAAVFLCGFFVSGAFYLLYPPVVRFYPTAIRSTGIGAAVAVGRIGNTMSPLAAGLILSAGFAPATVFWLMALPLLLSCAALAAFMVRGGGRA